MLKSVTAPTEETSPKTFSELVALSTKQYGLITHAQAMSAGVNRMKLSRLVKTGVWEQVRPRVFRRAAKNQTEEQELVALCLWLGDGTLVSHRSAARLLGLNLERGFPEVTTTRRKVRKIEGVVCHCAPLKTEDRRKHGKIPMTNGARTIIDLASCLDEDQLAIVVEEAWRREVAKPSWVLERLTELGVHGRSAAALFEILKDCANREKALESALEVRMWHLLRKAGMPTPRGGYEFRDDYGQPGRIDLAYPAEGIAIECDGFEHHGTREAFEIDRLRTQRLAALGWRVFQVTSKQLDEEPANILKRVKEALLHQTVSKSSLRISS